MSTPERVFHIEPSFLEKINDDLMPLVAVAASEVLGIETKYFPSVVFDEKAPLVARRKSTERSRPDAVPVKYVGSKTSLGFEAEKILINPKQVEKLAAEVVAGRSDLAADPQKTAAHSAMYLAAVVLVSQFPGEPEKDARILKIYKRAVEFASF